MPLADLITGFSAWAQQFVGAYGYLGIFLVSFIGSASIILPVPSFIIVFTFGSILNPWLVGIAGGVGSAIGELTAYAIGRGGKKALEKSHGKLLKKTHDWVKKRGLFAVLILFAATPLPDDLAGVFAGVIHYDIRKMFLATLIGKLVLNLALAWGGFYGMQWVLSYLGGI